MNEQHTNNSSMKHSGRSIKKLYLQCLRALRASQHNEVLLLTQEIIDRQPDHARAHAARFSSLFKSKKLELARLIGKQAAKLNPKSTFILNNQACLELDAKHPIPAIHLLTSLIEQYGEQPQWLYNLALAYQLTGQLEKAISIFRRALDQNPKHDKAAQQLAQALEKLGHYEEASQAYNYCRLLRNNNALNHSQYIHCSAISNNISATSLSHELKLWGDKFIPKNNRYDITNLSAKSSLTIGFISPTKTQSWLERSVVPVAEQLSNTGDRIFLYHHSQITRSSNSIEYIDTSSLSDADFARRIRADKIDVLIDLCGMRIGNRQRSLGLQLASKQFSWLGHEGEFATPFITPLESKLRSQKNQLSFYINYVSVNNSPPDNPWPNKTFSGISVKQGLSYSVIKTWAAILLQCPEWNLELQTNQNKAIESLLAQRFSAAGISRDRVKFNPASQLSHGTIVLDNFIHNNPTDLIDALFNGVTAVTLSGELFPAQQNSELMKELALENSVCKTQAEFIQRAVELANSEEIKPTLEKREYFKNKITDVDSFTRYLRECLVN